MEKMSSRETILAAIRTNKPEARRLPDIDFVEDKTLDLVPQYKASLEKNGGKLFIIENRSLLASLIEKEFLEAGKICSLVEDLPGNQPVNTTDDPHTFNDVDLAILSSKIGVSENAALWIDEPTLLQRVLPFIAQHLVVVISKNDLVPTMHQAYAKINFSASNYGVFIAGPSKTADIEQSLVIGAHGPRSLTVIIIGDK
jgi:L-lactate dehydrogenase complex protein LldG